MLEASRLRPGFVVVLVSLVLAGPASGAIAPVRSGEVWPCADARVVPFVGLSCDRGGGLLEVFSPDGRRSLGLSHGPDAFAPVGVAWSGSPAAPACAAEPDFRALLIYAVPFDQPDRFAELEDDLRLAVAEANGRLRAEGLLLGSRVDFKFECVGGVVDVRRVVLPTPASDGSFATIASDLMAANYSSNRVKHWVFYDDPTHRIPYGGQGNICDDDRNVPENGHNGGGESPDGPGGWCGFAPMFAMTYSQLSSFVMLHEAGHSMGAVQRSSPHTSGAWHCNDGRDVMCYGDGGYDSEYTDSACEPEPFDCGHDDYFHPSPAPGSYLSSHWQLGSGIQRFVRVGDPESDPPSPPRVRCARTGAVQSCSFFSTSVSSGVFYDVVWQDGSHERVPSSGTVPPAVRQWASRLVRVLPMPLVVTVTDAEGRSASRAFDPAQEPANAAPVVSSWTCDEPVTHRAESVTCRVFSTDDSDSVRYEIDWGEGSTFVSPPYAPNGERPFFHHFAFPENASDAFVVNLTVVARDEEGRASAPAVREHFVDPNARPAFRLIVCSPPSSAVGEVVECEFRIDDDSSGVHVVVDWGDGSTSRSPPSGELPPSDPHFVSHAWSAEGKYAVVVQVTDNATLPATSEAVLSRRVEGTNAAPRMSFLDCEPAQPGVGRTVECEFAASDADSVGVAFDVTWGDGSIDRVPALGYSAPGSRVTATHEFSSKGAFRVAVTPWDEQGRPGSPRSFDVNVTLEPCGFTATGLLVADAPGVDVEEFDARTHAVPGACGGARFVLEGPPDANFDVCFDGAHGRLACFAGAADESGKIPWGTVQAVVRLAGGALATYSLRAGEAA